VKLGLGDRSLTSKESKWVLKAARNERSAGLGEDASEQTLFLHKDSVSDEERISIISINLIGTKNDDHERADRGPHGLVRSERSWRTISTIIASIGENSIGPRSQSLENGGASADSGGGECGGIGRAERV
jgi:hypothetical protein